MFTYYTIQNRGFMKNISIFKHRIYLQKNDLIDAVEIYENEILRYYSYTYKIWERGQKGSNVVESVESNNINNSDDTNEVISVRKSPKKGYWRPFIRWDNYEEKPHVDIYGESQNLVSQQPATEHKPLKDIIEVIKVFRRNLVAMNISEI